MPELNCIASIGDLHLDISFALKTETVQINTYVSRVVIPPLLLKAVTLRDCLLSIYSPLFIHTFSY